MRAERALLRTGEYLVGRACRRLPRKSRDQRYREWTAELPAILHDPEIRLALGRAVRMLAYAADTLRATALTPGPARRHPGPAMTVILGLLSVANLVDSSWIIWDIVRTPGSWVNYPQAMWSLIFVAWAVSYYFRSTARITYLILLSAYVAGVVANIGHAAQAPGDWVYYLLFTLQFVAVFLAWRLGFMRRGRAGGHGAGRLAR
jgi:hypothetical protein